MAAPSLAAPLVLVIDDIEDNREMYAQFLRHEGLRVVLAEDGELGLAQAAALQPSAIILDLGMPKMDGWEVARRLKANEATRAIPIIALTGHDTREARQRALDAGVDEFCTKPCLPPDLVATIRRHLK